MRKIVIVLAFILSFSARADRIIEEVIVTAQKHAESANDVGITMNAFTGQRLKDLGVVTAEDLALQTQGLTVSETAATGVPLYTIRGVGFQDYSTAASSTVGLYFDEAAIPYTVMSRGTLFDVERVEVLKERSIASIGGSTSFITNIKNSYLGHWERRGNARSTS